MANFFTKIFGTHSSHELKKIYPIADKVEALEEQFRKLSDEELRAKTDEFKKRYQDGETLDQLLPEAFATCREASWRVLGMRHYRVQIIGGIILMVPGVAFTNAIRDMVDSDYISGSVRMLDAVISFFCIAIGVGVVLALYGNIAGAPLLP